MDFDRYRFLDPWWLLLPERGAAVLAVAGSGGRSTLLRRLREHYRAQGRSVLWTQTAPQPAPVDQAVLGPEQVAAIAAELEQSGAAFVAGPPQGRLHAGLLPSEIERLRQQLRPDIVLVDAHARCERPLRRDGIAPIWPEPTHLALLVAPLACVGRVYGPDTVAGVAQRHSLPDGTPRRILSSDVLQSYFDPRHGMFAQAPEAAIAIPFLTGFGSYRDMDGMFELVTRLWSAPTVRAVCLAELLGEARRDAADLRELPQLTGELTALQGERIYAVYPSNLDL